ncbi:MAG: hypothetical protein WBB74_08110 [Gaiellaceae bacterium]
MAGNEDVWIPLVDEPIGSIVQQIQEEDAEIGRLVETPNRLLAFRTFAYIRVGLVLGQLLVDEDIDPYDGSETWVDKLLRQPMHRRRVVEEVKAVALEIARDPRYAEDEPIGPDELARERVRETLSKKLGSG